MSACTSDCPAKLLLNETLVIPLLCVIQVISGYRASHAARAWKGKNTYKRHMSIRVEERVDQLKTIRATILKELDKTKTLQQLQELKNYRDPSRSVITIINAILLIIHEERFAPSS